MFTLGDVANILDDALDMGINIVDALHKLADAGDKGRVSRDNCRNELGLSGNTDGSGSASLPVSNKSETYTQEYNDGPGAVGVIGSNKEHSSSSTIKPDYEIKCEESNENYYPDSSSGIEDLSGYSRGETFTVAGDVEESPLKLSSCKLFGQSEKPSQVNERHDYEDIGSSQEEEYYNSPLKDYKSKKWSTTSALNLENDELEPMFVRDFLESPVKKVSTGSYDSSEYENDMPSDYPTPKRRRRNTYSIESTPVSEAEEKGLPIIDALDDLCWMADCFINENWNDRDKQMPSREDHGIDQEEFFGYYSGEEEISPTASRLIDEKIFALDRETAKALESFQNASKGRGSELDDNYMQKDRASAASKQPSTSIHRVVDDSIAYIGDQAKLVLKSFEALKNLKQYNIGKGSFQSADDAHDSRVSIASDFSSPVSHSTQPMKHGKSQANLLPDKLRHGTGLSSQVDTVFPVDNSDGQCKDSKILVGDIDSENLCAEQSATYLEESFPCEFKTVKDVLYEYSEDISMSRKRNKEPFQKNVSSSKYVKRPGTFVLECSESLASANLMYNIHDEAIACNDGFEKEVKKSDTTFHSKFEDYGEAQLSHPHDISGSGVPTCGDKEGVCITESGIEKRYRTSGEHYKAELEYPDDKVNWQTAEGIMKEGNYYRKILTSKRENCDKRATMEFNHSKVVSKEDLVDVVPVKRRPGTFVLDEAQVKESPKDSVDLLLEGDVSTRNTRNDEWENADQVGNHESLVAGDSSINSSKAKEKDASSKVLPKSARPGTYVLYKVHNENGQQEKKSEHSLACAIGNQSGNGGLSSDATNIVSKQNHSSGLQNVKPRVDVFSTKATVNEMSAIGRGESPVEFKKDVSYKDSKGDFQGGRMGDVPDFNNARVKSGEVGVTSNDGICHGRQEDKQTQRKVKRPNTFLLESADKKANEAKNSQDDDANDIVKDTDSNSVGTVSLGNARTRNEEIEVTGTRNHSKRPGTFVLEVGITEGIKENGDVLDEGRSTGEKSIAEDDDISSKRRGSTGKRVRRPNTFVLEKVDTNKAVVKDATFDNMEGDAVIADNDDADDASASTSEDVSTRKDFARPSTFVLERSQQSLSAETQMELSVDKIPREDASSKPNEEGPREEGRAHMRPRTFIIQKQTPLTNITNRVEYNDGDVVDSEVVDSEFDNDVDTSAVYGSYETGIENKKDSTESEMVDKSAKRDNDVTTSSCQRGKSKKSRPGTYTIGNGEVASKSQREELESYIMQPGFHTVEVAVFNDGQECPATELSGKATITSQLSEQADKDTSNGVTYGRAKAASNLDEKDEETGEINTERFVCVPDQENTKTSRTVPAKSACDSGQNEKETEEIMEIVEKPISMTWRVLQQMPDPLNKSVKATPCNNGVDFAVDHVKCKDKQNFKEETGLNCSSVKSIQSMNGDGIASAPTDSIEESTGNDSFNNDGCKDDNPPHDGSNASEVNAENKGRCSERTVKLRNRAQKNASGIAEEPKERVSVTDLVERETKEEKGDIVVLIGSKDSAETDNKNEFYISQIKSSLPKPATLKETADVDEEKNSSMKFSLTSTVKIKEGAELNNNEVKTVERDFSYKTDYIEMADDHAVLSTFAECDCSPDENDNNGAAVLDFSKKPAEDRVRELEADESKEVVGQGGSLQGDYHVSETSVGLREVLLSQFAESTKDGSNHAVDCDAIKNHHDSFADDTDAINSRAGLNEFDESVGDGVEEQKTELKQTDPSAFEADEEMARGRIALKLEINISDINDNFNDGSFASGKGQPRKKRQKPHKTKIGEGSEDSHSAGSRESDKVESQVDLDDAEDASRGIQLTFAIDERKENERSNFDYASQGIKFDVKLDDDSKKTNRLPDDLRRRLSSKTRKKVKERPGTYVLNSPIFSRDEHEDESVIQKCLARRSLGSPGDFNLQDEIRKAVEKGRLEMEAEDREGNFIEKSSDAHGGESSRQGQKQTQDSKNVCMSGVKHPNKDVEGKERSSNAKKSPRPGTYVLENVEEGIALRKAGSVIEASPRVMSEISSDQGTKEGDVCNRGSLQKKGDKRESLDKFRKGFEKQRIGFFVDLGQQKKDRDAPELDIENLSADAENIERRSWLGVVDESEASDLEIAGREEAFSGRKLFHGKQDEPQSQDCLSEVETWTSVSATVELEKQPSAQVVKKRNGFQEECTDFSEKDKELNSKVNIWINESAADESPAIVMVNNSSNALEGEAFSDTRRDSGVAKTKGIRNFYEGRNASSGDDVDKREMVHEDEESMDGPSAIEAAVVCRIKDEDSIFTRDANDAQRDCFENELGHEQRISTGFSDSNKARYRSWEITPDAEREVLHRISSLSEQEMRMAGTHETVAEKRKIKEDEGVNNLIEKQRSENSCFSDSKILRLAEKRNASDGVNGQPMHAPTRVADTSVAEARNRKSDFFVVEYDSCRVDAESVEEKREDTRKNSPRGGECFVIGEEFDASRVARRKSRDRKRASGATQLEPGTETKGVQRKETFVIRKSIDSNGEGNMKTEESAGSPGRSSSEVVHSEIGREVVQEAESIRTTEESTLTTIVDRVDSAVLNNKHEVDMEARPGQDETVVEDFDLYVSNGSRPSSGISEPQSNIADAEGEQKSNRADSLVSVEADGERGRIQDGRLCFEESKVELTIQRPAASSEKRPFDRQLSDSVVTMSHRTASNADVNFNLAGNYERGRAIDRQVSENAQLNEAGIRETLAANSASLSMPSLDSDLTMNPFKLPRTVRTQNLGHRPLSYDVARKPLLERLEKLCTFMTKSLTKLNTMSEDESEIVVKVDKRHGKEDMYLQRRLFQEKSNKQHFDPAGEREEQFFDERDEERLGRVNDNARVTHEEAGHPGTAAPRSENTRKRPGRQRHQRVKKDDHEDGGSRDSLAPRLAVLKMQLKEKRRHIEEEKRRMMHQLNEERTKLGQQAFWLAVGKESPVELERREQEKQAALDAERKKKPGLIFFPFSDENDPAKIANRQERKKSIAESPPNECSTPMTPIPHHNQGELIQSSPTVDYQVQEKLFGSVTRVEASQFEGKGGAFLAPSETRNEEFEPEDPAEESSGQVFFSPDARYQSKEVGFEESSYGSTGRRTAWTDPYVVKPDDFPPYQRSVDEGLAAQAGYNPGSPDTYPGDVPGSDRYPESGATGINNADDQTRTGDALLADVEGWVASGSTRRESPRGISKFSEAAGSEKETAKEKRVAMVISGDGELNPGDNLKTHVGVNDDLESVSTTLTPEQQKKKEKFLQNRMKRQQEEKAKREAEQERKRRKEEKIRERKAQLEKKENEELEMLKKQKEEEEMRRKRERVPDEGENTFFRIPRRDDQWSTSSPGKRLGAQSGSSRSPLLGQIEDTQPSSFAEYKGPPVYVKPTGKSNRQIMVNAISYCCLSGEVNREAKEKSLQVLSQSNASHFFVLFRDGLKFRGLYTYAQEVDEAQKLYGVGPKVIVNKMVERLFKYSSGAKSFTQIPAKSLSIQVDGIQIKKECWNQGKGTSLPSKTDSNLRKGGPNSSKSDLLKKGSPKSARR